MRLTDIKDFKVNDNFIRNSDYLSENIISELDDLGILDMFIEEYVNHTVNSDLEAEYGDFEDTYCSVAYDVCDKLNLADTWSIVSSMEYSVIINYAKNECVNCNRPLGLILDKIIERMLYELILYKPVGDFLNLELAMKIYKQTHGNVAQFPYDTMITYISNNTYTEDDLQKFVDTVVDLR